MHILIINFHECNLFCKVVVSVQIIKQNGVKRANNIIQKSRAVDNEGRAEGATMKAMTDVHKLKQRRKQPMDFS